MPEGRKWIVIVTPGKWKIWNYERWMASGYHYDPDVVGTGYRFEYRDSSGNERSPEVLGSGTYHHLDLHIFGCKYENKQIFERPVVYLILEVDE